jgi:hypothetical protein
MKDRCQKLNQRIYVMEMQIQSSGMKTVQSEGKIQPELC